MVTPVCEQNDHCRCDGSGFPRVTVKCGSCSWRDEMPWATAGGRKVGERFNLGRVFRCEGCKRRNTCTAEVTKAGIGACING